MAHRLDEIAPALARLDAARAAGKWVAGYIAYEAGYALEPKLHDLMPQEAAGPRLAFGIYAAPQPAEAALAEAQAAGGAKLAPLQPLISREAYGAAMDRVMAYIAAGDCYQINLTFPMATQLLSGTPVSYTHLDVYKRQAPHRGCTARWPSRSH